MPPKNYEKTRMMALARCTRCIRACTCCMGFVRARFPLGAQRSSDTAASSIGEGRDCERLVGLGGAGAHAGTPRTMAQPRLHRSDDLMRIGGVRARQPQRGADRSRAMVTCMD